MHPFMHTQYYYAHNYVDTELNYTAWRQVSVVTFAKMRGQNLYAETFVLLITILYRLFINISCCFAQTHCPYIL